MIFRKLSMIGQRVGNYIVEDLLGEGGMGAVYRARHVTLGRRAAIKVLLREYSANAEIVKRFLNEAKAATEIHHLGIVEIYDFGQLPDDTAYIAMELLDGESLSSRIRRGQIGLIPSLRIIRQMCGPLGAAHDAGIVHRDLKPDNVFIVPDAEVEGGERIKLLDFGIAKVMQGPRDEFQTRTGAVMGTPMYMAPEQCRGVPIDHRADLYALGCILYHLLAGRPPFTGEGPGDILGAHMFQAPAPLSTDSVPGVSDLVQRLLAKQPADRPQTAREVAAIIDRIVAQTPSAPGVYPPSMMTPASETTLSGSAAVSMRPSAVHAPRRGLFVVGGLAIVTIAAGATVIWSTTQEQRTAAVPIAAESTPSPQPTSRTPQPPQTPTSVEAAPRDNSRDLAVTTIRSGLAAFTDWAKAHKGAPCPDASELGLEPDPWGTALQVTCTDQPSDQIIGIASAGPDKAMKTTDDLRSWDLGGDISGVVSGARWKARKPHATAKVPATTVPIPQHSPGTATPPKPQQPETDQYGIPIHR